MKAELGSEKCIIYGSKFLAWSDYILYNNYSETRNLIGQQQGEGREGVVTAIHRASPSVMRASRGVRRSNCKQIWLGVHDPSEGMLKLLLYKILLV